MKKIKYFYLAYFLLFASTNISTIYVNLYYKDIGFSGKEISIIVSVGALITIVGQPLLGKIADKLKNKNSILKLIIFFSGIFFI